MLLNKLDLKLLRETNCVAFPTAAVIGAAPHLAVALPCWGVFSDAAAHLNLKGTAANSVDLGGFGDLTSEGTSCFREDTPLKTCRTVKGCPCLKYNWKDY